jgi:tetratricopeptide (TPR) repeat protein
MMSKDADALVNLGEALADLNQFEKALEAYDQALALNQNDATTWVNKAKLLRILGREAEAQVTDARAKELGG